MNNEIAITVDKDALLGILKDNRGNHGAAFRKAWDGYTKLVREELEGMLAAIKDNKPVRRFLNNVPPEDHTNDYDDVIDMLQMSINNTVDLTQPQFRQYVKDDWGWKQTWEASNTAYIAASG